MTCRAGLVVVAVVLIGTPAIPYAEVPDHDARADSLTVLLEEQGWSADAQSDDLDAPVEPGLWDSLATWLNMGVTPNARWSRAGVSGAAWRAGAGWRHGGDQTRTDVFFASGWTRGGVGAGRLTLRAASGLLAGGAGRSGPPSASGSLMAGRAGWRPFTGSPVPAALTGLALEGRLGSLETSVVSGERDRKGLPGGGGQVHMITMALGTDHRLASLARVQDRDGEGWSIGASVNGSAARFRTEAAIWRPTGAQAFRSTWIASIAVRAGALGFEGQVAARESGFAPAGGARPQVLTSDGRRGWALRGRWRGPGVLCKTLLASARGSRVIDDFPATSNTRRYEVVLSGGSSRGVAWRGRLAGKSETVNGWSVRQSWLPAAEITSRSVTRLSARVTGAVGETRVRATASGVGLTRIGGAEENRDGWRRLIALRIERSLGAHVALRFNQVWAWGEPVDLVSVEVPASGFMRPRHWGHRDRERSVGVCWRGRQWRLSAAIAAWDVVGEGPETEVVAGLSRLR